MKRAILVSMLLLLSACNETAWSQQITCMAIGDVAFDKVVLRTQKSFKRSPTGTVIIVYVIEAQNKLTKEFFPVDRYESDTGLTKAEFIAQQTAIRDELTAEITKTDAIITEVDKP